MTDPVAETIGYYNRHAADFGAQTANVDMEANYQRFLPHIPTGGRILGAGCGVGRDTLAFADRGYDVVAIDASSEMVRLACERVGDRAEVHLMRFQDVQWCNEFDGIWTCASLLHVPAASFDGIARLLTTALRAGGVWYTSFKVGIGERMVGGRLFVDHDEETLRLSLEATPVDIIETWISVDARPDVRTSDG
jgi:2-polyprenyl-3-methyl-5-hydroxy-6-metoxy-1,4-benzoquinol methylase